MTTAEQHPFLVADLRAKARGIASNLDTGRLKLRPLLTLDYATELIATAEAIRVEAVWAARASGSSWSEIAAQMSMTKQAAWQRYGDVGREHSARFRQVSNRYPRRVAEAYEGDVASAMADDDATVAAKVSEWERSQGLTPEDWVAIGRDERGDEG